ncbi:hypothetical protein T12_9509 [Trichinella patagoniensis]|uniref:Uncharacterized protein n=1 Tax=Trichinella patagoniensis TaxID=990121 RepID=A0A0V1A0Z7_9BILA|nr:hypothetical protein T12_9509 [Trichinella patagoniensis]
MDDPRQQCLPLSQVPITEKNYNNRIPQQQHHQECKNHDPDREYDPDYEQRSNERRGVHIEHIMSVKQDIDVVLYCDSMQSQIATKRTRRNILQ